MSADMRRSDWRLLEYACTSIEPDVGFACDRPRGHGGNHAVHLSDDREAAPDRTWPASTDEQKLVSDAELEGPLDVVAIKARATVLIAEALIRGVAPE